MCDLAHNSTILEFLSLWFLNLLSLTDTNLSQQARFVKNIWDMIELWNDFNEDNNSAADSHGKKENFGQNLNLNILPQPPSEGGTKKMKKNLLVVQS